MSAGAAGVGRLPAELGFDGVDGGGAPERLLGDWRVTGLGDRMELPPAVGSAVGERHRDARPEWIVQAAIGGVAVDLKRAAEAVEVTDRVLGASTFGAEEGHRWRV